MAEQLSVKALEKGSSLWKDAWIRLRKNKLAMAGLIVVILICFACFVGRWFLPLNPNDTALSNRFAPPGSLSVPDADGKRHVHLLGTDQLGRDMLTRILDGGQISLFIAIAATLLTVTIGVIYGSVAGYVGGRTNAIMMRIVDGLLAMPFLIVVILFRELIEGYVNTTGTFLTEKWRWESRLRATVPKHPAAPPCNRSFRLAHHGSYCAHPSSGPGPDRVRGGRSLARPQSRQDSLSTHSPQHAGSDHHLRNADHS